MEELWHPVPTLPTYEASDQGRIRNAKTQRIRKPVKNNHGFLMISIRVDDGFSTRSVSGMVADAFLGIDYDPKFNSIIHCNIDRTDCRLDNLLRRPRDFAILYHRQFEPVYQARFGPSNIKYREVMTQEVYENIKVPAMKFGLLCKGIYLSACNRGGESVFPTWQRFVFDHW